MPNFLGATANEVTQPHLQLIGTLIVAVVYGFITCLFLHTISLLITNTKHSYTSTMRLILIIYIAVMYSFSTGSAIQAFVYITGTGPASTATTRTPNIINMNEPMFLPLAIFGADGFMLWRSIILYRTASLRYRVILYGVLFCISTGTLTSSILFYLAPKIPAFNALNAPLTPSVITISITTCLNLVLTSIIVGRLIYHQEGIRRALGAQFSSPYMRVIFMLVESCSLIVVTGIIFLVFVARGNMKTYNGCIIPFLLLPHVCVLSPLIVIYQVARGRAITKSTIRLSQIRTPNIEGMMDECLSNARPIQFSKTKSSTFDQSSMHESEYPQNDKRPMESQETLSNSLA